MAWKPLPTLRKRRRASPLRPPSPTALRRIRRARLRRGPRRSLPYEVIRAQVEEYMTRLTPEQAAMIPEAATLPEKMVGLALLRLGWPFQAQITEEGGRIRLGGAVVDYKVWIGARPVIVRVQGDYWHSLPDRVLKDAVQFERLQRMGYLVADPWESDLYQAWVVGGVVGLTRFVERIILNAQ